MFLRSLQSACTCISLCLMLYFHDYWVLSTWVNYIQTLINWIKDFTCISCHSLSLCFDVILIINLLFFQLGKNKYHKSHHFDYSNDVSMLVGEEKPGIGGEPLAGQKTRPRNSAIPRGSGTAQPAWVAFDRQVLCFDAYFQEAVHEKREELYRIRQCKMYFYLEDDSIQIIEPRQKNSGIPQGVYHYLFHYLPLRRTPLRISVANTIKKNIGVKTNLL